MRSETSPYHRKDTPNATAQFSIGRKVCIYGHGGKTTLSHAIANALNLHLIELDAIYWMPQWKPREHDEMTSIVLQQIHDNQHGWVAEGNYRNIIPHLLPIADTVIWLNMSSIATTLKTTIRTFKDAITRKRICGDNYESPIKMFGPDSIIWYKARHTRESHRRIESALQHIPHSANICQIRSYRELNRFYNTHRLTR